MTVTATQTEALEAMLAHHRSLTEGVERRVAALRSAVSAGSGHGPRTADLVAYLAEEVLPHALAEERTIYLTASKAPDLAPTVREMTVEHGRLAELSEQLARATGEQEALAAATSIAPLFSSHVDKENDVLLPRLLSEGVLADLLGQMHEALEGSERARPVVTAATDDTALPGVLALLLESVKALSAAGEGDRACRLAASAWAALRGPRPELAVRVTAALHGLVRAVTAEPVKFNGRPGTAPTDDVLDVRQLAPAQRHEVIFETYEHLAPGAGFLLVNDHDPKPLRYQFEAEHSGQVTWEAIEAGPQVWRVRIGRPAPEDATSQRGEPELDVRRLAHAQRHETIFAAYDALAPGAGFVLVNDHDPKPLRYQFEAQYAGRYTWDYAEAGPQVWRVRIGRPAVVGAAQ